MSCIPHTFKTFYSKNKKTIKEIKKFIRSTRLASCVYTYETIHLENADIITYTAKPKGLFSKKTSLKIASRMRSKQYERIKLFNGIGK